jgi:hypothetical protein
MRPTRYIFFLLITLFIGGKTVRSSSSLSFKEDAKKKYGIDSLKTITNDSDANGHHSKHKKKARCVEVLIPHVDRISFTYLYSRNYSVASLKHFIYTSHLENANGKRGPPIV